MTIERMGSEADLRIEAAKSKPNILLLGPGWPKKQLEERPGLGHCVCTSIGLPSQRPGFESRRARQNSLFPICAGSS